jgi:hypothetical protein
MHHTELAFSSVIYNGNSFCKNVPQSVCHRTCLLALATLAEKHKIKPINPIHVVLPTVAMTSITQFNLFAFSHVISEKNTNVKTVL